MEECKTMASIKNAMSSGNIELLGTLLTNAPQKCRDMVLFYAADEGLKDVVQLALIHGANVNIGCEVRMNDRIKITESAISLAARMGHKEIVELLLGKGAKQFDIFPLYGSLIRGQTEIFELLLDRGFDVNYYSGSRTLISLAAGFGSKEIAQLVLDRGANIDGNENEFFSPIATAAMGGYTEIVKLLLDRGARHGIKALSEAVRMDRKEVVKLLLDQGFDANTKDGSISDMSVLYSAAFYGHKEIVELLLDRGANINEAGNFKFFMHCADAGGHEKQTVQPISDRETKQLDCLARLESPHLKHMEIFKLLLDRGFDVNYVYNSSTLLSLAAHIGRNEMTQLLLDYGANIDGNEDCSPIASAAGGGHTKIVKLLLDRGARQDSKAFQMAISFNHKEVVELLLERGFDTNTKHGSNSVLYLTARHGNKEIVELLLDHGANINGNESDDVSPIIVAAVRGHKEIVALLLERGAERNVEILCRAVCSNETEIVKLLLDQGCDVDINSVFLNLTPLVTAVYTGNREILELLLDYGAYLNGRENEHSPMALAAGNGHKDIVAELLNRGADINKEFDGMNALKFSVDTGNDEISKFLIWHLILTRSENLNVSEANLNAAKTNEKLFAFQNHCSSEIELLQSTKFDGSLLSYFDVFNIKDVDKLTALASNENIVKELKSNDFRKKFPTYGDMIVEHFNKGVLGNKDFELFKKFCNYLSTRNSDQLPKLPFTSVCKIFNYLGAEDVDKLRNV